ncbi:hypothetical protein DO021_10715 [Desulfobacter hydrogenophilus]|uniref:Class I SAM-dependent methyltransferase n=1 Tax=Desulfobacter hydrogenophilus TaxID=2291 RepID=A0A328FD52_9BACT|nr:hypothetical protein [Desulfobacter hydrogenophilus]NDY71986.1 hypothetical protein [Desulfobacter hydrogenophilus]QBH12323.1 hypothetical protein EYB58_04980 [Desulfobacter hydrogenophilus]RAM02076.1 hypothetical protein DO021_10715 [Desulfobacter hydrogenophilus]
MAGDDYLGSVNWNCIYRAFHNPFYISQKIKAELKGSSGDILFAGFSDTAIDLSYDRPLTFIDSSPVVTEQLRNKPSPVKDIITSDICSYAASTPATFLLMVCRISAFWNTPEHFEKIVRAITAYPRKLVLIDFYDSSQALPGLNLNFTARRGTGSWYFEEIKESSESYPPFQTVNIKVAYSLPDMNCCYNACRSFFKKSAIKNWAEASLPDYITEIKSSLFESDPSFLLKLCHR